MIKEVRKTNKMGRCEMVIFALLLSLRVVFGCGNYKAADGSIYWTSDLNSYPAYSAKDPHSTNTYYWNFCTNLTLSDRSCYTPSPPMAAQVSETGNCISYGYYPQYKISDHPTGPQYGVTITYTNGYNNKCGETNRQAKIIVTCSNTQTSLISIQPDFPTPCVTQINMASQVACPRQTVIGCGNFTAPDGSKYNLAGLTRYSDYFFNDTKTGNGYYWSFCNGLYSSYVSTVCKSYTDSPWAVQVSPGGTCIPLGYGPPKISNHPDGPGVSITYTNTVSNYCLDGSNTKYRTVIIQVKCVEYTSYIYRVSFPETCVYLVEMESSEACPLLF